VSTPIAASRARSPRARSAGRLAELQARVVDDADREVARGSDGELLVAGRAEGPRHGFFAGF